MSNDSTDSIRTYDTGTFNDSIYGMYLRILDEAKRQAVPVFPGARLLRKTPPGGKIQTADIPPPDPHEPDHVDRIGVDARQRNDPRTFQPTPMGLFYNLVSFGPKTDSLGFHLEHIEPAFDDMTNGLRNIENWMEKSPDSRKRMAEFKESNPNAFRCFDEFVSLAAATEELLGTCQRIAAEESERRMYAASHSPQNDSSFSQANKFYVVVEPKRAFSALFVDPVAKLALRLKELIQANADDEKFSAVAEEIVAAYDRVSAANDSLEEKMEQQANLA